MKFYFAGKDSYDELSKEIVEFIPDDRWLEFVKVDLQYDTNQIEEFRIAHCEFTDEQKYQMLRNYYNSQTLTTQQ